MESLSRLTRLIHLATLKMIARYDKKFIQFVHRLEKILWFYMEDYYFKFVLLIS